MSAQADQKQGEHSWRRLGSGSERARQRSLPRDPWGGAGTHCEQMQPGCVQGMFFLYS